jgi:hypothetical protein
MLSYISFVVLIIIYTYFLKKKFQIKLMEPWTSKVLGSGLLVYVMIVLPVVFSAATVFVFSVILKNL